VKRKYQHIDHTADVGLQIFGSSLKQLFENAAEGMFDFITELQRVDSNTERHIEITAGDRDALLVTWLSELNYILQTEDILFKDFLINDMSDTRLQGIARGEQFEPQRHVIYTEVKAVTYHQLYIRESDDGWQAQVIFDL